MCILFKAYAVSCLVFFLGNAFQTIMPFGSYQLCYMAVLLCIFRAYLVKHLVTNTTEHQLNPHKTQTPLLD